MKQVSEFCLNGMESAVDRLERNVLETLIMTHPGQNVNVNASYLYLHL